MPRSQKIFQVLLRAYPSGFRREFGSQMAQLFRDCYRAQENDAHSFGAIRLWLHTLLDLAQTAPREHWENLGKGNSSMSKLLKDALALLGCFAIIAVAFWLLSYGRK